MGVVRIFLIIIEVIVCFLLVGIILLQKSKSSGLGMAFGSGMGESLFGAQAGNVLTKGTVILASIFLVNTTLLALIQPAQERSLADRMLPATDAPPVRPETRPPPVDDTLPDVTPHELPSPGMPLPADPPPAPETAQPVMPEAVPPPMDEPMPAPPAPPMEPLADPAPAEPLPAPVPAPEAEAIPEGIPLPAPERE